MGPPVCGRGLELGNQAPGFPFRVQAGGEVSSAELMAGLSGGHAGLLRTRPGTVTAAEAARVTQQRSARNAGCAQLRIIVTHIFIKSGGVQNMRMRQTLNRHEKLVQSSNLSSYFHETAAIKFHQTVVK